MFIKRFKQKSNVQMKTSDYKKLRQRIQESFPNINETELSSLFPNKSTLTVIKVVTFNGANTNIYCVDKRPMLFEDANELIPTLYTLWITPDILPYLTTHTSVLPRLAKGADLMLPGVIRTGSGMNSYGHHKKGTLIAVNLTSNSAAVGVGRLVRSTDDLYMSGGHGPCVKLLNVFGDYLWGIESTMTMQIPIWKPVINIPNANDFPLLGDEIALKKNRSDCNILLKEEKEIVEEMCDLTTSPETEKMESQNTGSLLVEKDNMDDVIKTAFLTALKYSGKDFILPLLTSNFYRLHILPVAKSPINLKQSTYKKISVFLNEMSKEHFITLRQETKGVEKIVSINLDHPELINFIPKCNKGIAETSAELHHNPLFHVAMTELYIVTDDTIPFFTKFNFQKGEGISNTQIKKLLKEYVSKFQLSYEDKQNKIINLDFCLAEICNKQSSTLDDIYHTILSKMTHSYEMRGRNEIFSNKPPIEMSLATRSGNKKVTLVTNLEAYDIILSEFSKVCKQGAAASTSIIKSKGGACGNQIQIQGNQVKFIYKILTETYKIPAKQVHGLELAKKERKKK